MTATHMMLIIINVCSVCVFVFIVILQTEHKMSVEEVTRKFQTDIVQVSLFLVVWGCFTIWALGGSSEPLLPNKSTVQCMNNPAQRPLGHTATSNKYEEIQ